jgi:hypothetical protein
MTLYDDLRPGDLVTIRRTLKPQVNPDGEMQLCNAYDFFSGKDVAVLLFVGVSARSRYYFISEHGLGWRYAELDGMYVLRRIVG